MPISEMSNVETCKPSYLIIFCYLCIIPLLYLLIITLLNMYYRKEKVDPKTGEIIKPKSILWDIGLSIIYTILIIIIIIYLLNSNKSKTSNISNTSSSNEYNIEIQ